MKTNQTCKKQINFHGGSKTPLYNKWRSMRNRCKPNWKSHKNYYDRGIKVCDEWQEFLPFKTWREDNGYKKELDLDRIDNNKGYSPDNCRFITHLENSCNKSDTVKVIYEDKEWALALLIRHLKIRIKNLTPIRNRYFKYGWSLEDSLFKPITYKSKTTHLINIVTKEQYTSYQDAADSIGMKKYNLFVRLKGKV